MRSLYVRRRNGVTEDTNTIEIVKKGGALGAIVKLAENASADAITSEWTEIKFNETSGNYEYNNNGVAFAITKNSYDYAITNLADGATAAKVDLFKATNGTTCYK